MNDQPFRILEFDGLRRLVRPYAQTAAARAAIDRLVPIDDYHELTHELRATAEMIELRRNGIRLSFAGIADTSEAITRLKIAGAALEPLAMLDLARLCESAVAARTAIAAERESCPTLFELVTNVPRELQKLAASLQKKILPGGELDDRASPQLAAIRRDLTAARSRITRALENLMRRSSEAIQEELVTVRNDRFVIPVRVDHQSRIKGVAHGASSSGATIFIEPLETIEANNELQQLREAEQREIAHILFALSDELRRHLPEIELAAEAIAELDFAGAKASFAETFNCVVPTVSQPRNVSADPLAVARGADALELIDARHPLLEHNLRATGGSVVPVSITLDADHPVMVISGANAGGKTVVLKTTGLLVLMALSALPVPAKAATVPSYKSVLADIGDHQSLAANLSTFTSHVANIAKMIELCGGSDGNADAPPAGCVSLVLLDEVGTGTDPEEGSALGVAVVDHFKRQGAHVMATTHYSGLKMYGANEPGVANASVEFDEKTLRPTYRLLLGFAGSSSGLEIAHRFGIPAGVIKEASAHVRQSSLDAIAYLSRIKREADEAESLRRALQEERDAVADKFASLEHDFQKREAERQKQFREDLARSISEFEKLSRELVTQIEDRAARVKFERESEKRAAELKREAQRAAQQMSAAARSDTRRQSAVPQDQERSLPPQLRGVRVVRDGRVLRDADADKSAAESRREVPVPVDPAAKGGHRAGSPNLDDRPLKVGDRVRLRTFGSVGIIDRIRNNEAEVRVGSLHMREKLFNLELANNTSVHERGSRPTVGASSLEKLRQQAAATELHLHSSDSASRHELNLIGKKTDEATDLLDKFLDEAFLNGQTEVRIIHGHGTGALRKAVAELLSDHPHVEKFAGAAQDQGGSGATIVQLRV